MIYKQAVIIGKFMPLHKGHMYLIQSAIKQSAKVTVLVCTLNSEPIPGNLRFQWVKQTFPTEIDARHITEELPQYPNQHPDFWNIWCNVIKNNTAPDLDVVFSSETYGRTLGQKLNISFVDVDINRITVPINATVIRQRPLTHWNMISDAAKPYYAKKIAIVGPESVGKTTLTEMLAKRFDTVWAHQYGRQYNEKKTELQVSDFEAIARGHIALQNDKLRTCNKILFCDTQCIVTKVFLDLYFEQEAHLLQDFFRQWIETYAKTYEMYILIRPKAQGVQDGLRKHLHVREEHFQILRQHLVKHKVPFETLDGGYQQNFSRAVKLVEHMIAKY